MMDSDERYKGFDRKNWLSGRMGDMQNVAEETGYNGWKNYETWAVALWIDNDQGSYTTSRAIVSEAKAGAIFADTPTFAVANALEAWIKDDAPDLEASLWSDLLGAALSEVSWYEIAENYLSELDES
jgi:hypothetical protein